MPVTIDFTAKLVTKPTRISSNAGNQFIGENDGGVLLVSDTGYEFGMTRADFETFFPGYELDPDKGEYVAKKKPAPASKPKPDTASDTK